MGNLWYGARTERYRGVTWGAGRASSLSGRHAASGTTDNHGEVAAPTLSGEPGDGRTRYWDSRVPRRDAQIFLNAPLAIRAARRFQEMQQAGQAMPLEQVVQAVAKRDAQDRTRVLAPLTIAPGRW